MMKEMCSRKVVQDVCSLFYKYLFKTVLATVAKFA